MGAGAPRIEVLPPDELPIGEPGDAREELPTDRGANGAFAPGNTIARKGGLAKRGKTKLAERMGLADLSEDNDFARYRRAATSFRKAQCTELARSVGGGVCGVAPSSLVASAALQLAWSRYLADRAATTGDPDLAIKASRLAEASRQSLLAAHELCAKEATARARRRTRTPQEAQREIEARILGRTDK
jgi:hypothetical protein